MSAVEENISTVQQIVVKSLSNDNEADPGQDEQEPNGNGDRQSPIDSYGLICLCLQHSSSSFGDRLAEFAFPLFLVELFTGSLLPASIYGFVITAFGILFSGSVAALVDSTPRLRAVRFCILGQKFSSAVVYAVFLAMFLHFTKQGGKRGKGEGDAARLSGQEAVWFLFAAIVLGGSALKLATVGINVAIERDWAMQISRGSEQNLTRINLIIRRVDLLSNLLAPLFVSLLTTAGSYVFAVCFLLGLSVVSAIFEFIWIEVVYLRFPMLKEAPPGQHSETERAPSGQLTNKGIRIKRWRKVLRSWLKVQVQDWRNFASYPVFMSSVSISLLYLSVLSFDATFLSYLKSTTDFSDPFISGMRGICVLTGLLGTFIVPILQRHLGLTRAGSWSIAAELISLIPALVSFYVGATYHRPAWNVAILFTGLALSRIGLWAFDVVQLTQLQMAFAEHPRRNALTGLQYALQNLFDLAHYGLTIGWSSPGQFKYAATVSFGSVFLGLVVYVFGYARRLRGHAHLNTSPRDLNPRYYGFSQAVESYTPVVMQYTLLIA